MFEAVIVILGTFEWSSRQTLATFIILHVADWAARSFFRVRAARIPKRMDIPGGEIVVRYIYDDLRLKWVRSWGATVSGVAIEPNHDIKSKLHCGRAQNYYLVPPRDLSITLSQKSNLNIAQDW